MAKPEWGRKRMCHACGALFYDLQRAPILCPKCGVEFDPEAILKSRRSRVPLAEEKAPVKPPAPAEAAEEKTEAAETAEGDEDSEAAETAEGDEDSEAAEAKAEAEHADPEDASDLTEDEDDMAEVREHLEEKEKPN